MSDAVWFYTQNDQERGPVSPAELRSLAAAGKLKGSDLVWKDGMEDWTAAAQIKGLLPDVTPPAPPSPPVDNGPRNRSPVGRDATPRDGSPQPREQMTREPAPREPAARDSVTREPRWIDGPPADDATPSSVPRVPMSPAVPAPARAPQMLSERRPRGSFAAEAVKYLRPAGMGLAAVGLLLVLTARGCDALADRYAARVVALARVEEESFNQDWSQRRRTLEAEIQTLGNRTSPSQGDTQRLASARVELQKLNDDKSAEQQELSVGRWADLRAAAATVADDNRTWGFWRGILLVFGTFVLVPGLLIVGFVGEGVERWLCLAMLAVITFSLYVGGSAWQAFGGT